jgi:histidine triad (HIT) family protein
MTEPDWYCAEVLRGTVPNLEIVHDSAEVLAFRPPRLGFGVDHVILVPRQHVPSLLELELSDASAVLSGLQAVAAELVDLHGGCQVLTTLGNEQRNKHLHFHIAVGEGVARFVNR